MGNIQGLSFRHSIRKKYEWQTGLAFSTGKNKLDYSVNGSDGRIPFRWYSMGINLAVSRGDEEAELTFQKIIPGKPQNSFDNRLHLETVLLGISKNLPFKLQLESNSFYQHSFFNLRYKEEQYGKLDNPHLLYSNLRLTRKTDYGFGYHTGSRMFFSTINDDSYFDIWPFSFWDMFMASRTRLKKADITSFVPYISCSYAKRMDNPNLPVQIKAALEYNQILHTGEIIVKQRRVILYPFFFTYDTYNYDFQKTIDGFFVIPCEITYHKWGCAAGLAFQQLIPINWNSATHQSNTQPHPGEGKTKETGGTTIRFYIDFPL